MFGDVLPEAVGEPSAKLEAAAERLAGVGALPPRREAAPIAIARTVMTRVAEILDIPVSDVLVGAWRMRSALLTAARETADKPGLERDVTLKGYSFSWHHDADIDVTFDRATIVTVIVSVSADVDVVGLAAVLKGGRLTRITSGEATASVSVRATTKGAAPVGLPIAEEKRTMPIVAEVALPHGGLPLVDQATAPSARE